MLPATERIIVTNNRASLQPVQKSLNSNGRWLPLAGRVTTLNRMNESSGENTNGPSMEMGCRSPELISRDDSALLVVDLQKKLLALIPDHTRIAWNAERLVRGAKLLGVAVSASEQYPERLGGTVESVAAEIGAATGKRMFSCRECQSFFDLWKADRVRQIVVCGIESHVCVLQTSLDLLAEGFSVYVVVDAIGARGAIDHEISLRRLEICGAVLTTTESVLFEWCESSTAPEFKQISALITQQPE